MEFGTTLLLISGALFATMFLLVELGRRLGERMIARDPEGAQKGIGAVEGSLFALFGLLLAFTFSGAAERLDHRRHLIVEEANAIGTAYLRIDLLPEAARPALRRSFRDYVDSRIAIYAALPDLDAAKAELRRSGELQEQIWTQAVAASRESQDQFGPTLALGALNEMIDITTTRTMATRMHPPAVIYVTLFVLALASAVLVGFGMAGSKSRNWVHILSFLLFTGIAIYVIFELEYPRMGFIGVKDFDQVLVEERGKMDAAIP